MDVPSPRASTSKDLRIGAKLWFSTAMEMLSSGSAVFEWETARRYTRSSRSSQRTTMLGAMFAPTLVWPSWTRWNRLMMIMSRPSMSSGISNIS